MKLPILMEFVGGPSDGLREHLCGEALGLKALHSFELATLTTYAIHTYRCELWDGSDSAVVHHERVKIRSDVAAKAS